MFPDDRWIRLSLAGGGGDCRGVRAHSLENPLRPARRLAHSFEFFDPQRPRPPRQPTGQFTKRRERLPLVLGIYLYSVVSNTANCFTQKPRTAGRDRSARRRPRARPSAPNRAWAGAASSARARASFRGGGI